MPVEWLLVFEGPGPPSLSPLLHFLGGLAKILQTVFHKMVRTTTSKTILIFLLIQLNCFGKMDNIPTQMICFSNSTWGSCILSDLSFSLFFLFCLYAWVFSASLLSTVVDRAVKVWLPFNFWEGNKFPDDWEWVMSQPHFETWEQNSHSYNLTPTVFSAYCGKFSYLSCYPYTW